MKKYLFSALILFGFTTLFAQNTETEQKLLEHKNDTLPGWKHGGMIAINASQTSFSNWAAGGQNSMTANGMLNLFANYKKGNGLWENTFDLGYGTIEQSKKVGWLKSDDKIELSSKYGRILYKNVYYAVIGTFKSQMTKGYNYPNDSQYVSKFLAPGYVLVALGLDYKPNASFSAFFAPIASKLTIVNDTGLANHGAYGVTPADTVGGVIKAGKKTKTEFGGYFRMFYNLKIMHNIQLQTKLDLFSNYLKNPLPLSVSWQELLSLKINKYISSTVSTSLLYDPNTKTDSNGNIKPDGKVRIQFKDVIAVGFAYKF